MGNVATVEFDYEQFEKDNSGKSDEEVYSEENSPKTPKTADYDKVGELDYVKYYDYTMMGWLETKKFKAYTPEDESFGMAGGNYFNLKGGNRPQPLDMEEGNIKLIDGEVFSEKDLSETTNSILISKEVAEKIICRLAINLFGICIVKSLKIRWVTVMIVRLLQMMKMQRVKVQKSKQKLSQLIILSKLQGFLV